MRISDLSSDVCSSDLRRCPCIVLQHEEAVGAGADQIGAADMRPDAVWRLDASHRQPELRIGEDEFFGDQPYAQDLAAAIDVEEKGVDRGYTLLKADRKSTRLNSSHYCAYRMPSAAGKKKHTQHTGR